MTDGRTDGQTLLVNYYYGYLALYIQAGLTLMAELSIRKDEISLIMQ